MTVKLYYNPQSRAVTTRVLLEELGIPYELVSVQYDDGSMRTPEFLATNPMGKIPVVDDDGIIVTETAAIAIYLADKYKSPHDLAPGIDDRRRGDYLRWIAFLPAGVEPAMTQKSVGFEIPRSRAGWGSAELVWDVLKAAAAKADPFLLGDWFTAADVLVGSSLNWMTSFGLFPKDPEVMPYIERITSRPAFARATK